MDQQRLKQFTVVNQKARDDPKLSGDNGEVHISDEGLAVRFPSWNLLSTWWIKKKLTK